MVVMVIVIVMAVMVVMVIVSIIVIILDNPSIPELIPRDVTVIVRVEMLHDRTWRHFDVIFLELLYKFHEGHQLCHVQ